MPDPKNPTWPGYEAGQARAREILSRGFAVSEEYRPPSAHGFGGAIVLTPPLLCLTLDDGSTVLVTVPDEVPDAG